MENRKIEFRADGASLQFFKSIPDRVDVIISTGKYEWENMKDIPGLPEGVLKITIEPIVE